MSFSKMIELLQNKDKGKIILINSGAFYIARGKDAELNTQRIFLRIMKNNKWIDERKFKIAMEQIYEIGKILGGLLKYYAKNNKK